MSTTLDFVQELLQQGANLEKLGLNQQACRVYQRLANMRGLGRETVQEIHLRLGALYLEAKQFASARRHLAIALVHQPSCARVHFLLASANAQDIEGSSTRATTHYRQAVTLEPYDPLYLIDAGRHLLHAGERDEGLKLLQRALDVAADDVEVVGDVLEEMRAHDAAAEAGRWLQIAMFHQKDDARFRRLWNHHQFEVLRTHQRRQRLSPKFGGRDVLPFVRPQKPRTPAGADGRILRHDAASDRKGPKHRSSRQLPR